MYAPKDYLYVDTKKGVRYAIVYECPMCGDLHMIQADEATFDKISNYYMGNGYAQDVGLDAVNSEKLITGYCDKCQGILWPKDVLDEQAQKELLLYYHTNVEKKNGFSIHTFWDVLQIIGCEEEFRALLQDEEEE